MTVDGGAAMARHVLDHRKGAALKEAVDNRASERGDLFGMGGDRAIADNDGVGIDLRNVGHRRAVDGDAEVGDHPAEEPRIEARSVNRPRRIELPEAPEHGGSRVLGKRRRLHARGVDLDAEAVRIRKANWKDLHEAIIGDLREVNLGGRQFDIVYNAYVLEHIDGAEGVLQRFVDWLKPGGIIVLKMPDANSFYGLLTRLTPHWFHVLYYRHVQGLATAGQPGYAPYPTYYDAVVSRAGICAFARRAALTIEAEYGLAHRLGNRLADLVFRICGRVVNGLTLSRYAPNHVNLLYVLRQRA